MTEGTSDTAQPASSAGWHKAVQQDLAAARLHSTLPRRHMIAWIAEHEGPFSAEALVSELERERSGTRATVYRFIDWLRDGGWIARVYSDATRHTYIRRWPGHRHQAICTGCGTALSINECIIEDCAGH